LSADARLARAARRLGPRAADLGSNAAARAGDVAFVVGLTCDAPAAAPLVRGSLDAVPIQSGALTGVLVGDAPRPEVVSREIARVLQPGGVAIVASAERAWDAALAAAGFAVERKHDVVVGKLPGGFDVEIERPSLFSLFVPRRWTERRAR
jgi:SAM-dependent methyltransferase